MPSLPSKRYLQILQKGGKHSELAQEYQDYLASLEHYQALTYGQQVGAFFLHFCFGKPLMFVLRHVLPRLKVPILTRLFHMALSRLMVCIWLLHDYVAEPILGSGRHN